MSSPSEFREVMAAAVGYIDETVDQVLARHKKNADRPTGEKRPRHRPSPGQPSETQLKAMRDLLAKGKQKPAAPKG